MGVAAQRTRLKTSKILLLLAALKRFCRAGLTVTLENPFLLVLYDRLGSGVIDAKLFGDLS